MSKLVQSQSEISTRIKALGTWFHNLNLAGLPTAPNDPLGDYLAVKWRHIQQGLSLDLDLLYEHGVGDTLVFQSLMRGSGVIADLEENYPFEEVDVFAKNGFPIMHCIERRYADDPTNWWIPNRACVEAILRRPGFSILHQPEEEVYICTRRSHHG